MIKYILIWIGRYRMKTCLSEKLKLTIFRIVQEQLNNIFKHAKASNIIISLSRKRKHCSSLLKMTASDLILQKNEMA